MARWQTRGVSVVKFAFKNLVRIFQSTTTAFIANLAWQSSGREPCALGSQNTGPDYFHEILTTISMSYYRETIVIGALLSHLAFFATGASFGERVLGRAECKEIIEYFSMLGGWFSAICTLAAVWAALHISNKQNEILNVSKKEEIYDAFFELKMHMTQKLRFAERSEVTKFYHFARKSSRTFGKEISADINDYFEACLNIASINEHNRLPEKTELIDPGTLTKKVIELAKKIDSEVMEAILRAKK
jgi:hypothetical protein